MAARKGPSATCSAAQRLSHPLNIKIGKSRTREKCNLIAHMLSWLAITKLLLLISFLFDMSL